MAPHFRPATCPSIITERAVSRLTDKESTVATVLTTAEPALEPAMDRGFFGHPRGLSTLFFTEMWERFSYYGMRGFLILYVTASKDVGGLGLDVATGGAIYGAYTALVYLMSMPGGWIADRLIGQRRAVLYGGILIASGHYMLAVPRSMTFFIGLALIVLGTGLLKPNISVIVGQLYPQNDIRRDAGFSIFYMGINLGATLGPLLTGFLAQDPRFQAWLGGFGIDPKSSWHWGFGAAGVGMTLGLVQYVLGAARLGHAGLKPVSTAGQQQKAKLIVGAGVAALAIVAVGFGTGVIPVTPVQFNAWVGYLLLLIVIPFFAWLLFSPSWTPVERGRLMVIFVLFLAAALFWSLFEQAGSTLNLFADRSTRLELPLYGAFPASWFQALNSIFVVGFAPVFAWLWVRLGERQPPVPQKFALGLVGAGVGFVLLYPAAHTALTGVKVSVLWLTATYLIHTWGELCLSPVGLSAMTKLAPTRIVSLMMGVWFLAASVGNYLGGQMASLYEALPLDRLLGTVGLFGIAMGVVMWLFAKPLTRLMGGVR
jgi:POT family proton-dependent oligopeptide transporter